ncbi:BACON domain-containing carbohydrate-binding protein [Parabacteroides sp. PF5-6]|uniref:BACON domain-containing protein n=1 Tax=Parabacteroides sp. PF5-6 TaxID=1742403 RepID=UPI002406C39E|nr:BACON domain-containing carbohydrate-binding protein [Parabacteroides sp. PF5-6]MDF9829762.1 hypothetical protein [Parabacteroides sp. PF5-6]
MKRYIDILLAVCLVLATGCTVEEELITPSATASDDVFFELNIPGHKIPHASRLAAYDENTIQTLDVLFFGSPKQGVRTFERQAEINGLTTGMDGKVSVKLKLTPEEADWEIVFVANAQEAAASITAGDTKFTALEKLTVTQEEQWDIRTMPIPMYGEIALQASDIRPGKKIGGINMVRMLARIDLSVAPDVSNFTLEQVYLCNRSTQGYISADWDAQGIVNKGKITQPNTSPYFSFADDGAVPDWYLESDLNIRYAVDPETNSCTGRIYTFEAAGKAYDDEALSAVCLVIKGYLDDDLTRAYYYRVDFTDEAGRFIPVLRNYQYNVEIVAATGIGYDTVKEALDAYTVVSNMHTRTLVWDNEMLSHIHYNGQYMLGVQFNEMLFGGKGETLENFIATNYANGITIVEKPDWVEIENFTEGRMKASLRVSVPANPGAVREGEIKLQAGRVTHSIRVVQNKGKDRTNAVVNIASVTGIGFLGYTNGTGTNGAQAMRKVLDTHFSMGGVVELKQINYHAITNNPMVTDDYLSDKDVVFLVYAAVPTAATMTRIINWLEASPRRVLVISFDSNATNPEAFKLNYFKEDIAGLNYFPHNSYAAKLVHAPGTEYFWKDGPFTHGEPIGEATYLNSDGAFGEAILSSGSGILPLFESSGAMVFGVHPEKRIVYLGDSQYGDMQTSSVYQGQKFNNDQGEVNNNIEKIFANLWAWIIDEVVLKEQ